ncbi:MAG: DUF1318 domain-containing protein [Leptospiraceae bacterium]|nr:DUF1318 domain-containing protein [Leptospiraceae bacterium]
MKKFFIYIIVLFNFCTLNPPPITFTQSPTAAERQMLGDGKDIEKDGWILSSVRTSASGAEIWEKEVLDKELYEKFSKDEVFVRYRTLAYLAGEVRNFKKKGFLGESLSGKLALNPLWKESKYKDEFPKAKKRLEDILKIVNENREWIYNRKLELLNQKNLKPNEFEKEKTRLFLSYYNQTELGEYFEVKPNVWKQKE